MNSDKESSDSSFHLPKDEVQLLPNSKTVLSQMKEQIKLKMQPTTGDKRKYKSLPKIPPTRPPRCPIDDFFGLLIPLPENEIPSLGEVLSAALYYRIDTSYKYSRTKESISDSECIDYVLGSLMKNIARFSLPFKRKDMCKRTLSNCFELRKNYMYRKSNNQPFPSKANQRKYKYYTENVHNMFDCIDESKGIPETEVHFLTDQKKGKDPSTNKDKQRNMICGGLDKKQTKILQYREYRREKGVPHFNTSHLKEHEQAVDVLHSSTENDSPIPSPSKSTDTEFTLSRKITKECQKKNIDLSAIAEMADRLHHSNLEAARLTNLVSQLVDIPQNFKEVTTHGMRKRMSRSRLKTRKAKINDFHVETVLAIGFDGRKDFTKVKTELKIGPCKKIRIDNMKEEHITVVGYPGEMRLGQYITTGTGEDIANGLIKLCNQRNVSLDDIKIVMSDGTSVNTGCNKGAIHVFETFVKRPLLFNICRLHAVEKPFQHLIKYIDGPTDGPNGWSGPIGKEIIKDLENLPIAKFIAIPNPAFPNCPQRILNELNNDQKYAIKVCEIIMTGKVPSGFDMQKPGRMHHARWITTGARIGRLYISTENPTQELERLTNYFVFVYMPVLLETHHNANIKIHPDIY